MRIKDIVSISGMVGLYKMEGQKQNGMIVTSLTEGWTKFVSNRQRLFSPLENISIYTDTDNIELDDVMLKLYELKDEHPPVDPKSDNKELRDWFLKIIPEHDQEKVYASDIKEIIKWYEILLDKGVIEEELKARKEEDINKEKEDNVEAKEEKNKEPEEDA